MRNAGPDSPSAGWSVRDAVAAAGLTVLAALPFLQVTGFSFLNYDDPLHVSGQPAVLAGLSADSIRWSLTATPSNLWHPLTWLSYMLEVSFFGGGRDAPGVHHTGNLLLHLGSGLLFFVLLRLLRFGTWISGITALLFCLHPLHVEPVAWISSRKDVLYAFFSIAALCTYRMSTEDPKRKHPWFWITLLTCAMAMASKSSAVVLPVLFVLLDLMPGGKQGESGENPPAFLRRQAKSKWPFFLLAGIAAITAVTVQYSGSHGAFIAHQGLVSRLMLLPGALAFYLQRILWPLDLTFDYANPTGTRYLVLTALGAGLIIVLSVWSWRMRRRCPAILLGWLWLLACLLPVLGFFYVGSGFTADRYTYLALAGPSITLAAGLGSLNRRRQSAALATVGVLAVACGILSHRQASVWKDDVTLFSHGVTTQPRSAVAHTNLASVFRTRQENDRALAHYRTALELGGSDHIIHYNIAQILVRRGERPAAITACRQSLRSDPGYARSHHLLASLLEQDGTASNAALHHFGRAHEQQPESARFAISHALALARRGLYADAERTLQQALEVASPNPPEQARIRELLRELAARSSP